MPPTPDPRDYLDLQYEATRAEVQRAFAADDVAALSRLAVGAGFSSDEAGVQDLLNLYIDANASSYEAPRGEARDVFLNEANLPRGGHEVEYENEEEMVALNPSVGGSGPAPWPPADPWDTSAAAHLGWATKPTRRVRGSDGWVYEIDRNGIMAYHPTLAHNGRWVPKAALKQGFKGEYGGPGTFDRYKASGDRNPGWYLGAYTGKKSIPFAQAVATDILQRDPGFEQVLKSPSYPSRGYNLSPADIEGLQEAPPHIGAYRHVYGADSWFPDVLPGGATTPGPSSEFTTSSYSPEILAALAQQYGVTVPEVIEILGASTR